VLVDKVQVQQVIFNLVRNSVEAMSGEPPPRELIVATALTEPQIAEVSISDTGPGLAPKVQAQLFQPFVTTKEKGMGLGLSICRSIIDAHGGRLWATPNPHRGVKFQFTLPLADDEDPGDEN
jgi:two-component system, LuxR family, sensor kinase FixL